MKNRFIKLTNIIANMKDMMTHPPSIDEDFLVLPKITGLLANFSSIRIDKLIIDE